ncbi:MAG: twin-arginine translocase TatA/TatE family subunit [Bacteroidales bacterium]|jgi:sec-independent protein translocase protein TatA
MDALSPMHILLVLLVLVLLFGGKKIPEMMKGIGQGVREFKKASSYDYEEEKKEAEAKAKDQEIKVSEKK